MGLNLQESIDLGLGYWNSGRRGDAAKMFLQLIREYPEDLSCLRILSDIFRVGGNAHLAHKLCEQIIAISPTNPYANKYLKLSRKLNQGPNQKANLLVTPGTVHFLMNDKCNAKCVMCGGDYFDSKTEKSITFEQFKQSAKNLHMEDFKVCLLAGGGDPLVNQDVIPMMEHMRSTYPQVKLGLVTNAISLTKRVAQAVIDCNVGHINCSINSATRETFRHIMQVDAFEKVCRNIKRMDDLRKKHKVELGLQFSSAINRINIEEMPDLVRLSKKLGVESVNLMYCRFYPETIRHLSVLKDEERLRDHDSLFFDKELSDRIVKESRALAQEYGIAFSHEALFEDKAPPTSCSWTKNQLMVGFEGEIYPCGGAELHMKPKVEGGVYDFGNAITQPLEDYWNNDDYLKLRISSEQTGEFLMEECSDCANIFDANKKSCHIYDWTGFETKENLVQLGKIGSTPIPASSSKCSIA